MHFDNGKHVSWEVQCHYPSGDWEILEGPFPSAKSAEMVRRKTPSGGGRVVVVRVSREIVNEKALAILR
jgi:hypothetical protein